MSDKERINGWLYTHWDCHCGAVNEVEGDAKLEEVKCRNCDAEFIIERVL